jgi:hypothetical protein
MRLLFVLLTLLAGCASTNYLVYDGRNNVFEGTGGARGVVDGMDVWEKGQPPRKYRLLGFIDDARRSHPLTNASIKSDAVKKAREVGGDALIMVNSRSEITGAVAVSPSPNVSAVGLSRQIETEFAVIKYLQ